MLLATMGGHVLLGAGGCEPNGELRASLEGVPAGGLACDVCASRLQVTVVRRGVFLLAPNEVWNVGSLWGGGKMLG